jgi:hypothetical protein
MKKIAVFITTGVLIFFLGGLINSIGATENNETAGVESMREAIKHAEEAKTHKAHPEHMHDHAKMSLEHVKKAKIEAYEKGRKEGEAHVSGAIQHLVKAIEHAEKGHSKIAGEHIEDALLEMQRYVNP